MAYGIGPKGYLARARARLLDGSQESLFYAAFELRCFVEAQQDEHLDAQKEYVRSIPKAYKIGAQGKQLERLFESSRIQHVRFIAEDGYTIDGFHVPVRKTLRNGAERLGKLLHAQMKPRPDGDAWWAETEKSLKAFYREAWPCSKGNLFSPMFLKDGITVGKLALEEGGIETDRIMSLMRAGTKGLFRVEYLTEPPVAWVCDI
jgi:hypothetical protein